MLSVPPPCVLRRGVPEDFASYAPLCRDTFRETFADSHPVDALERHVADAFPDVLLHKELSGVAGDVVFVVEAGGELLAYALLTREPAPVAMPGHHPLQISRFYIASAWHGKGVAAPLMHAALDEARRLGADVAWLGVWEHNMRALRFYDRQGFVHVGETVYKFDGVPERDLLLAVTL